MKKNCPKCNKELECTSGENIQCWCSELPQIIPLEEHNGCLCKDCLKDVISSEITSFVNKFRQGKVPNLAIEYDGQRKSFIKGIDFYVEGNFKVFTEWYHLRRGSCCGNNCRHCPYKPNSVTDLPLSRQFE